MLPLSHTMRMVIMFELDEIDLNELGLTVEESIVPEQWTAFYEGY